MKPAAGIALFCLSILAGCDGPKESAGREQDRAISANSVEPITGVGPNQRLGKAQDQADRADAKARDARADALEVEADRLRTEADIAADRLEKQAKAIRSGEGK